VNEELPIVGCYRLNTKCYTTMAVRQITLHGTSGNLHLSHTSS